MATEDKIRINCEFVPTSRLKKPELKWRMVFNYFTVSPYNSTSFSA